MSPLYPRDWHRGRLLLLVTWLTATTSYLSLFFGATYVQDGFLPHHLLLGLLLTQAVLLGAALLTFRDGLPSLIALAEENPRRVFRFSLVLQAALLLAMALAMQQWNDERHNLFQASYFAEHGLRKWLADYETINRWLGLHHPPLLALLYAGFYAVVGEHLLAGRVLNIVFSLLALAAAYRLVARLTDRPTAALATLLWPLFPLWLFNGAAAIMEGASLLVFLLVADSFVAYLDRPTARRALATGAWVTLALLCRYNVALLFPGMLAALLLPNCRALLRKPATYWIAGVPLLALAPVAGWAAGSGLLTTQAARLTWMALLARPGGLHYLLETLLPLWPLHLGGHVIPLLLLGFAALWLGGAKHRVLLALGGGYFLLVMLILPNPRYLLPAVPFVAAGAVRLLAATERRDGGATATWLGLLGAGLTLTLLVVVGSRLSGYYPFY